MEQVLGMLNRTKENAVFIREFLKGFDDGTHCKSPGGIQHVAFPGRFGS